MTGKAEVSAPDSFQSVTGLDKGLRLEGSITEAVPEVSPHPRSGRWLDSLKLAAASLL